MMTAPRVSGERWREKYLIMGWVFLVFIIEINSNNKLTVTLINGACNRAKNRS